MARTYFDKELFEELYQDILHDRRSGNSKQNKQNSNNEETLKYKKYAKKKLVLHGTCAYLVIGGTILIQLYPFGIRDEFILDSISWLYIIIGLLTFTYEFVFLIMFNIRLKRCKRIYKERILQWITSQNT